MFFSLSQVHQPHAHWHGTCLYEKTKSSLQCSAVLLIKPNKNPFVGSLIGNNLIIFFSQASNRAAVFERMIQKWFFYKKRWSNWIKEAKGGLWDFLSESVTLNRLRYIIVSPIALIFCRVHMGPNWNPKSRLEREFDFCTMLMHIIDQT